jgi:hypothetical protein
MKCWLFDNRRCVCSVCVCCVCMFGVMWKLCAWLGESAGELVLKFTHVHRDLSCYVGLCVGLCTQPHTHTHTLLVSFLSHDATREALTQPTQRNNGTNTNDTHKRLCTNVKKLTGSLENRAIDIPKTHMISLLSMLPVRGCAAVRCAVQLAVRTNTHTRHTPRTQPAGEPTHHSTNVNTTR